MTDSDTGRKGMKATVVLFFFLGMNSLLFCINPKDSGIYEDAYMMTNAILKGSQVRAQTGYTIYIMLMTKDYSSLCKNVDRIDVDKI